MTGPLDDGQLANRRALSDGASRPELLPHRTAPIVWLTSSAASRHGPVTSFSIVSGLQMAVTAISDTKWLCSHTVCGGLRIEMSNLGLGGFMVTHNSLTSLFSLSLFVFMGNDRVPVPAWVVIHASTCTGDFLTLFSVAPDRE